MNHIFDALRKSGADPGSNSLALQSLSSSPIPDARIADTADPGLNLVELFVPAAIPEHRLVALSEDRGPSAEGIRILSTRLRQLQQSKRLKTLLITSSIEKEGKSFLSANLAISFARTKQSVLLLDGDIHRGSLSRLLGVNLSPGLGGWWRSGGSILQYLRRTADFPLWFMPAGELPEFPLEMLQSSRLVELLAQLGGWFDWIIVDSPPLAPLADAAVWWMVSC